MTILPYRKLIKTTANRCVISIDPEFKIVASGNFFLIKIKIKVEQKTEPSEILELM